MSECHELPVLLNGPVLILFLLSEIAFPALPPQPLLCPQITSQGFIQVKHPLLCSHDICANLYFDTYHTVIKTNCLYIYVPC